MPLSLLVLAPVLAMLPTQAPAAVPTQVRSAALFKNGLAFVQRSGSAPANATQARIDALPIPTHGTFWITPGSGTPAIASAVARKSEIVERVPATDIVQLLRANVGRRLTLIQGESGVLHGTLAALPEPPLPDDEERARYAYGYMPQPVSGLLILELDSGGSTALDPRQVTRVVGEGSPLSREYERRRPATSLSIQFAAASKAPASFELSYLERGLTWVPSYSIDLSSDGGTALLSAKAEVIDEAEDLAGATLLFVTGYPNLQFAHVADPIALRGNLEAFLSALGQPAGAQQSQVLSQSVMSNSLDYERGVASLPVAPEAAQGGVEDLFLYEQRDVTLARGERGLYPLLSARVPCEHVYEWEIPDTVDEERRPREGGGPHQEEIWHSLRLTNETGTPWTTAPAMTQKGGNILGQDTLRYTAVGAKTNVRITRALDIQGEQNEFEIARERNSAQFYSSSYDKVTVRGELRISNFKKEPVRLEVRKRIQGEVTKNPGKAEVVALAQGLRRVNPSTRLSWTVALEPGKPAQLEYEYTLYVRN